MPALPIWNTNNPSANIQPPQELIQSGFKIDTTGNNGWLNWFFNIVTSNQHVGLPVGSLVPSLAGDNQLYGYLLANGTTIGNSGSGATHANAMYEDLFTLLWTGNPNAVIAPGGRGASAQADWTANKTLELPNLAGYTIRSIDATNTIKMFTTSGTPTVVLTESELPAHTHPIPVSYDGGFKLDAVLGSVPNLRPPTKPTPASTPTGGNQAHNNIQPSFVCNWFIKF